MRCSSATGRWSAPTAAFSGRIVAPRRQELDVTATEMLVHLDDDSLRCPSAEVRYRMADGATTIVRIETIGGMIGSTRRRYGWESVGDVSVDGEPGGWGFLEVNNNPRNGDDPPAFALADAFSNGIIRRSRERRSPEDSETAARRPGALLPAAARHVHDAPARGSPARRPSTPPGSSIASSPSSSWRRNPRRRSARNSAPLRGAASNRPESGPTSR